MYILNYSKINTHEKKIDLIFWYANISYGHSDSKIILADIRALVASRWPYRILGIYWQSTSSTPRDTVFLAGTFLQDRNFPKCTQHKESFDQDATPFFALTSRESIENELSSYLQPVCLDSEADPLRWWREHEVAYPAQLIAQISLPSGRSRQNK